MILKKVIIIAYFGKLPNYFELFLNSCSYNLGFSFIIFTDQSIETALPSNVNLIEMTFEGLNRLVKQKLGGEYAIYSPYKLCDYRPAYGVIFEDYIDKYDVWGYCDIDLILGDIGKFISEDQFRNFDRLLVNGHLSFYKNNKTVNSYYQSGILGNVTFDRAVSVRDPFFFDEIFSSLILSKKGIPIYKTDKFLDVLPKYSRIIIKESRDLKNYNKQKFAYQKGHIYHEYNIDGRRMKREYMYIHLQKRIMKVSSIIKFDDKIYINSNIFTLDPEEVSRMNRVKYRLTYLYRQLAKINLNRIRIKLLIIKHTNKYKGGVG